MSSYIFTPSHTSVCFQKRFHFINHSCCSFLHLWEKTKKAISTWLALDVEIAFLTGILHALKEYCQHFKGDVSCPVTANFVLIFEIWNVQLASSSVYHVVCTLSEIIQAAVSPLYYLSHLHILTGRKWKDEEPEGLSSKTIKVHHHEKLLF